MRFFWLFFRFFVATFFFSLAESQQVVGEPLYFPNLLGGLTQYLIDLLTKDQLGNGGTRPEQWAICNLLAKYPQLKQKNIVGADAIFGGFPWATNPNDWWQLEGLAFLNPCQVHPALDTKRLQYPPYLTFKVELKSPSAGPCPDDQPFYFMCPSNYSHISEMYVHFFTLFCSYFYFSEFFFT